LIGTYWLASWLDDGQEPSSRPTILVVVPAEIGNAAGFVAQIPRFEKQEEKDRAETPANALVTGDDIYKTIGGQQNQGAGGRAANSRIEN
jgi:hypothetical protein